MVLICLRMIIGAAISFRAVPKAIHTVFSSYTCMQNKKIPCHKTVTRWITQVGHYKLHSLKEQATDWGVMIDFSIQVGTQKCLVILGKRLSQLEPDRILTFEDLEPLVVEIHEHTNATIVREALQKAASKVGSIRMCCSDEGSDVAAGVRLFISKFGKLKHLEQEQSSSGFTTLILAIPACVGKLDIETITHALTTTRGQDVLNWRQQNLGMTLQAKRRQALKARQSFTQPLLEISGQEMGGFSEGDLGKTG